MAIPQATRDLIIAMAEDPAGPTSVRQIAKEVGVSPATVSRVLKEGLEQDAGVSKSVSKKDAGVSKPPRARSGDRKPVPSETVSKSVSKHAPRPSAKVREAIEITRDQTLSDMFSLLQVAKQNLLDAVRASDDSPQSRNAINGATRAVTEILRELGKWCGLQDSIAQSTSGQRPASELSMDELIEIIQQGKP